MAHRLSREEIIRALGQRLIVPHQFKGGNAHSGYVRRMEAENKLVFNKVSRPSKFLINKYGSHNDHDDSPLFGDSDDVEYNVRKIKPKRTTAKNRGPTEVQQEREEAQLRQAQREQHERKQKQLDELDQLKKLVMECHKMLQKEDKTYEEVIDELLHRRGMKKVAKSELQEQIIVKHHANIKKIKQQYAMVFSYAKTNKLGANDLNQVHKHIRAQITKSQ
jgi:hypothetical protein